jgi:hypothetical protein
MQPSLGCLAVPALEPGSRDAKSAAQPGSQGTRFLFVCPGPGSLHALACMLPAPAREEQCRTRSKPNSFFLGPGSMDTTAKQQATASRKPGQHGPSCRARARLRWEGNQTPP